MRSHLMPILAVEQGNEADEALELKMLHNGRGVVNVRFAAYCRCWADQEDGYTT